MDPFCVKTNSIQPDKIQPPIRLRVKIKNSRIRSCLLPSAEIFSRKNSSPSASQPKDSTQYLTENATLTPSHILKRSLACFVDRTSGCFSISLQKGREFRENPSPGKTQLLENKNFNLMEHPSC